MQKKGQKGMCEEANDKRCYCRICQAESHVANKSPDQLLKNSGISSESF